ncbi:MAG: hypothetical protein ACRCXL_13390 [Dermatophilaceae bacterium]
MHSLRRTLGILMTAGMLLSACGLSDTVTDTKNDSLGAINDALQQLGRESGRWQEILQHTTDQLIAAGQSTLANEVSNVAGRAISDAGIEARCYTDFLGDRVREELLKIRARISGEAFTPAPVFCNPTPNTVKLSPPAEGPPAVEISGYNLSRQSVQVWLVGAAGRVDVTQHLSNPSPYLLTLNTGANGVPFGADSAQLEFQLQGSESRTVTVVQPEPRTPPPDFPQRTLHVSGIAHLNDDENAGADDTLQVAVDDYVAISADGGGEYHWDRCLDDEVHGFLDVQVQLDRSTGALTLTGNANYYESDECGRTDNQGNRPLAATLKPGESHSFIATMEDGDGHVNFTLTFSNV